MIEATPWGQQPSYLIHDHDRVYGADFATRLTGLGIKSIHTPIQAPRANAIAARIVRSLRQECLDHILPLRGNCDQCWPSSCVTTTRIGPTGRSGWSLRCQALSSSMGR